MRRRNREQVNGVGPGASSIQSMAPNFRSEDHQIYLDALESAIADDQNRSIALSGSYGMGKSSVLQKFATDRPDQVVEISFSGLAAGASEVEASEEPHSNDLGRRDPKTNHIQKEIVKQLLYRESPTATPASRYKRPESFKWTREIAIASSASAVISVIAYLVGAVERPIQDLEKVNVPSWAVFLAAFLFIACISLIFRYMYQGSLILEKLTAGPATISLSPQSTSFFDEYLDEIVYFFEASKRRIVIFEDLDRFDNKAIFRDLGSLNTLLNRASQIQKRPVVFIYAVRDSIFADDDRDEEDVALGLIQRADRTKFFDVIIPMVPFISASNARDVISRALAERHLEVSEELVDVAARHIPDMRLVVNIVNEFTVFRRVLIAEKRGVPGLSDDKLFAIVLYKNVHLLDFERIRIGSSELDLLYEAYRKFLTHLYDEKLREARASAVSRSILARRDARAESVGEALLRFVEVTSAGLGHAGQARQFVLNGAVIDEADLYTSGTWREIAQGAYPLLLTIAVGRANILLTLSVELLRSITTDPLSFEDWEVSEVEVEEERNRVLAIAQEIPHYSMRDLSNRDELKAPWGPEERTEHRSFDEVVDLVLKSHLARLLVRAGHIDEYFAVYTAQFHGNRVSAGAQDFLMRFANRGQVSMQFPLSDNDAAAVLRERPSIVRERSILNVALVDEILAGSMDSKPLISRLLDSTEESDAFLTLYFDNGSRREELVTRLTARDPGTISKLVSLPLADPSNRRRLVDVALRSISEVDHAENETLATYIEENHQHLDTLNEYPLENKSALEALVRGVNPIFADVSVLSRSLREIVVDNGLYEFTRHNILQASGSVDLTLEGILHVPPVYDMVRRRFAEFLEMLSDEPKGMAVTTEQTLLKVLNDVDELRLLDELARFVPSSVTVSDLTTVPKRSWETLAKHRLIAPTARNAHRLVLENEVLGSGFASTVRARRGLLELEALNDDESKALAKAIIQSPEISAGERARIARGILRGQMLSTSDVPPEAGELVSSLLKRGVLPDDLDTFVFSGSLGWPARESVIIASKQFTSYVSPVTFTGSDVSSMLSSTKIPMTKKRVLLGNARAYSAHVAGKSLWRFVQLSRSVGAALSSADLLYFVSRGLDGPWAVAGLAVSLSSRSLPDVVAILSALGGDYARLRGASRKPHFPNDEWHRALGDYLVRHGLLKFHRQSWWSADRVVMYTP